MRHSTKRRIMLGMTTGGVLVTGLGMSTAHADTAATGATTNSPGIGSGNLIQVPINAPINICGNQVDVIGLLNTDHGSFCANHDSGSASASGSSTDSPGIGSGNVIQAPINAPVNICGNQVEVIGILDTTSHNTCVNHEGSGNPTPGPTGCGCPPPAATSEDSGAPAGPNKDSQRTERSAQPTALAAHTGAGAPDMASLGAALIGSEALLLEQLPTGSL